MRVMMLCWLDSWEQGGGLPCHHARAAGRACGREALINTDLKKSRRCQGWPYLERRAAQNDNADELRLLAGATLGSFGSTIIDVSRLVLSTTRRFWDLAWGRPDFDCRRHWRDGSIGREHGREHGRGAWTR